MVDDKINWYQGIDLLGITLQQFHAVAHRRQVDNGRNAGKILHQHAGRTEAHFGVGLALVGEPGDEA